MDLNKVFDETNNQLMEAYVEGLLDGYSLPKGFSKADLYSFWVGSEARSNWRKKFNEKVKNNEV